MALLVACSGSLESNTNEGSDGGLFEDGATTLDGGAGGESAQGSGGVSSGAKAAGGAATGATGAGAAAAGGSAGSGATAAGGSAGSGATAAGGSAGSGATAAGGSAGSGATGSGGFGAAGGTGATGSGGSGAAGGTGGSGGAGGGPAVIDCSAFVGAPYPTPSDPLTEQIWVGDNGTFADQCDSTGNLIEYRCETLQQCFVVDPSPGGGVPFIVPPPCESYATGQVVSSNVDCGGRCDAGACEDRCPDYYDSVTYLSVGAAGAAQFRNERDGRIYQCSLIFTQAGADCTSPALAGTTTTIESLGIGSSFCLADSFGNIGLTDCSYSCTIISD